MLKLFGAVAAQLALITTGTDVTNVVFRNGTETLVVSSKVPVFLLLKVTTVAAALGEDVLVIDTDFFGVLVDKLEDGEPDGSDFLGVGIVCRDRSAGSGVLLKSAIRQASAATSSNPGRTCVEGVTYVDAAGAFRARFTAVLVGFDGISFGPTMIAAKGSGRGKRGGGAEGKGELADLHDVILR